MPRYDRCRRLPHSAAVRRRSPAIQGEPGSARCDAHYTSVQRRAWILRRPRSAVQPPCHLRSGKGGRPQPALRADLAAHRPPGPPSRNRSDLLESVNFVGLSSVFPVVAGTAGLNLLLAFRSVARGSRSPSTHRNGESTVKNQIQRTTKGAICPIVQAGRGYARPAVRVYERSGNLPQRRLHQQDRQVVNDFHVEYYSETPITVGAQVAGTVTWFDVPSGSYRVWNPARCLTVTCDLNDGQGSMPDTTSPRLTDQGREIHWTYTGVPVLPP
jgi:hypothetical protein